MTDTSKSPSQERWLKLYYSVRTAFSAAWVIAAFSVGQDSFSIAAVLLVIYPAWDALANYVDASRSGGLGQNRTQTTNFVISLLAALAVVVALQTSMNWVLGVFGVWAILSGLLQLGTAARRWRSYGAQWAMILSGGQSAIVGVLFIVQARMPAPPSITDVAGYAAGGAFYFLISSVWLTVGGLRRKAAEAS